MEVSTADRKVPRALHERRRGARRGPGRCRPHATVHVDARRRLQHPTDEPRLSAARAAGHSSPRAKHAVGDTTDHLVGSSVALPTSDLKCLEVGGPDGLGAVFESDRISGRSAVRFGKTERAASIAWSVSIRPALHAVATSRLCRQRRSQGLRVTAAPSTALPKSGTFSAEPRRAPRGSRGASG